MIVFMSGCHAMQPFVKNFIRIPILSGDDEFVDTFLECQYYNFTGGFGIL